ncbi:LLM class flavin-dependent oxidoreductase [Mycobacterium sp. 236(2023)]|uniref:LLM class flavin-dependent oxidoreductase n=1 Tax=Mycobacterium sp. 236(2023) TaxID=3038163 RepID=UPI0024155EBC|nr:LLM class flavin-dependent oxidoreductase [Mycobacterium sp. 236(2023)]MDG4664147.1 LLM class flavin-dependent oxidoreductase [Mycobacterium sp. 236(2023)]
MRFGVLLNMGASLGATAGDVVDLTVTQAELAEELGYDELWVTEHHFIRFGINPSALTAAGFLLGRTRTIRVGTSVVLSPLCHPVDLAERAALLDQLSGGRFELGLGRGGYRRDYEMLDVDFARWNDEPHATVDRLVDLWSSPEIQPPIRTSPHPPLLMATSSDAGLKCAAANGFALQHYFATPASARVALEQRYRDIAGADPHHLHTVIAIVDDAADARERLIASLRTSFRDGDHPHVPQAPERHLGPDGTPIDADAMAEMVGAAAIIGPVGQVVDELGDFILETGARRVAVYHEAIGSPVRALGSLRDFGEYVVPQLSQM